MRRSRVRVPVSAQEGECGNSSVGRALASQAGGREFEPRLPLKETENYNQKDLQEEDRNVFFLFWR